MWPCIFPSILSNGLWRTHAGNTLVAKIEKAMLIVQGEHDLKRTSRARAATLQFAVMPGSGHRAAETVCFGITVEQA